MNTTPSVDIDRITATARNSYDAGRTRPLVWRREVLTRLRALISASVPRPRARAPVHR